jgi:VWFA-related protein
VNKEQRPILSVVSAGGEAKTIGIFFDVSGSRRRDPLVANELAATASFLKSVWHAHDVGFVITFSDRAYTEASATGDLSQVIAGLHKVPAHVGRGSTALFDALCSVQIVGAQTGRGEKLFLVVSDFGDNSSRRSSAAMIAIMRQEGVRIFSLFHPEPSDPTSQIRRSRKTAEETAEKTGGDVFYVEKEKDLDEAFERLTKELQGVYVVSYEALPGGVAEKNVQIESAHPNIRLLYARE